MEESTHEPQDAPTPPPTKTDQGHTDAVMTDTSDATIPFHTLPLILRTLVKTAELWATIPNALQHIMLRRRAQTTNALCVEIAKKVARDSERAQLQETRDKRAADRHEAQKRTLQDKRDFDGIAAQEKALAQQLEQLHEFTRTVAARARRNGENFSKADDALNEAEDILLRFDNPDKWNDKQAANKSTEQEPVPAASRTIHHTAQDQTTVFEAVVDVNARDITLGIKPVTVTNLDVRFIDAPLHIMASTPQRAYPPRYREDIVAEAAVLQELLPSNIQGCASISMAIAAFNGGKEHPSAAGFDVVKLSQAIDQLLSTLRIADANRQTTTYEWKADDKPSSSQAPKWQQGVHHRSESTRNRQQSASPSSGSSRHQQGRLHHRDCNHASNADSSTRQTYRDADRRSRRRDFSPQRADSDASHKQRCKEKHQYGEVSITTRQSSEGERCGSGLGGGGSPKGFCTTALVGGGEKRTDRVRPSAQTKSSPNGSEGGNKRARVDAESKVVARSTPAGATEAAGVRDGWAVGVGNSALKADGVAKAEPPSMMCKVETTDVEGVPK